MNIDPTTLTPEIIAAVESVRAEPDPPADFHTFWQQTAGELSGIPLNLQISPADPPAALAVPNLDFAVWRATSLGGGRIAGCLVRPKDLSRGSYPQWVYGHGYGSVVEGSPWWPHLARRGLFAVGLDARGYGRSRILGDPGIPGWILQDIEDPSRYILRGAVADTIRAVEVARSLPGADPSRTVLSGGSFSGGLVGLAAPWIPDLRYIAVSVPTFGAYSLRRTLVERGSGKEVNDLLDSLDPMSAQRILENLRYFDVVNAAPLIRDVPVSVGLGVSDAVVPSETVAAIYHALNTADKELLSYPCSHSVHPLEREWARWDRHIRNRALHLV